MPYLNNPTTGLPSTLTADANGNLTFSARWIQSTNGAANAPPMALTGTWFTGGTSTTTKPQLLIEPAGTTSTSWSTAGTGLGVNAPSGFGGNLAWFGVGGLNRSKIDASGNFTASTLVAAFTETGVERYVNSAFANFGRQFGMYVEASGNEGGFKADSAFNLKAASAITFVTAVNGGSALTITSASTGTPRIIGVNGRIEFGLAGHLSIFNGPVVTTSVTVANLPAAATAGTGARSFVTDANATTFLSTVAGGGSNRVPVVSDGTNWLIA